MNESSRRSVSKKVKVINPIKDKQLEVLEDFRNQLRLLIHLQGSLASKEQHYENASVIEEKRLRVYDMVVPVLVTIFERMESVLLAKHPGGAPRNPYRDLAFDLLTSHYIESGKVLQPKVLVKAVESQLPQSTRDGDSSGKEPFSIRIAREVISSFKACLQFTPDDWN